MSLQEVGIIGMGVMGRNLALNLENHGYSVSIFNRSPEKTKDIIDKYSNKKLIPYYNYASFINSIKQPRCIILMIKAGIYTDQVINDIRNFMKKNDIIIDGGNSFYQDTIRRYNELLKYEIKFIGAGISGGEEGALKGPSIMVGGCKKAYDELQPMLEKIAAHANNESCVAYLGPNGAGHYVKMVHNGIEYSDMQLIAETYILLKDILKLNNSELSNIFKEWNKGELNSYLIDITKDIFLQKDEHDNYIIDMIVDEAFHKETGKWTSQSALNLGEPLTLITSAVFSRYLSSLKQQRMIASKILTGPQIKISNINVTNFIEKIRRALYLGKILSYAQGFSQLKVASEKYEWNLNYSIIAKIFRSGCVIRAKLLNKIVQVYETNPFIENLLLSPIFQKIAIDYQSALRDLVIEGVRYGISIPTFSAAIAYYDGYRSASLPSNLIQAQRDYFGSHTYKRIDKPGIFHTIWQKF